MPSLTDTAIRHALKRVEASQKQENLADGEGRGTGRLVLVLKPMPKRVTADWMAQQWRDGKRTKKKIGAYPSISLAEAREIYKRDYADVIQKGRSIRIATDTRPGTVADLFEGYVASLKSAGKPSWKETEKGLNKIADTLGRNRLAREIEPDEIVEVIRPIYDRGARAMADHVRGYLHAAYGWGMKSDNDYRNTSPRRFRIPFNPATGIPTEPKVQGTRWLDEDEFVRLYRWLESPDTPSLLMEQVLAPRFEFKPKNPQNEPAPGFDYGEGGYDPKKCNVGFNEESGKFQIEIKGLATPKSEEATRICQEDLNEVIAAFVQDRTTIERGLFDEELVPEELTQVRMGKIIKDKFPQLDAEDQEAVRQHAVAALNLTQKAKEVAAGSSLGEESANTAFVDGVRKFAMDVRELDIDLIDRINPFGEAYAILAKTMSEESLKQVAAAIAAKRTTLTPEEAKVIAKRAVEFKRERGRLPSISSADAWEKHLAEGAAAFVRFKDEGRYE